MRAVLTAAAQKSGWPRPSAGRPCARHRLRHREGQLRRHRGGSQPRRGGFTVERLVVVFECGAIVNPDGLNNQVEGAVDPGPGRRAVRGDRVRRRRHRQRHHGALPRAAFQGRPAASRSFCSIARICRRREPGRRRSCASRRPSAPRCARSARSRRSCRCGWCECSLGSERRAEGTEGTETPDSKNGATEQRSAAWCGAEAGRALRAREGGRTNPDRQVPPGTIRHLWIRFVLPPSSRPQAAGCQHRPSSRLPCDHPPFTPLAPLRRF